MADIVKGLFGVDPTELVQQRNLNNQAMAKDLYGQDPLYGNAYRQIYSGAGGMLGAAAPMLGIKDAGMEQAQSREQLRQQMDLSTPQGAYAAATLAKDRGDMELATNLVQYARQAEVEQKKNALTEAQTQAALRKTVVAGSELGAEYRQNVNELTGENVGLPFRDKGTNINVGGSGMKDSDYLKWMNQESTDYKAAQSGLNAADDGKYLVKEITGNKDFSQMFGGYTEEAIAKLGSGEIAGLRSSVDTLKNQLMAQGLNKLRETGGIGSMTEKEWPIMRDMIASLDYKMDEKTARKKFAILNDYFDRAAKEAAGVYSKKWNTPRGKEFYKKEIMDRYSSKPSGGSSPPAGYTPI